MSSSALAGLRILVAEDEYYFADDLAEELLAAGAGVIGPVSTVAEAMALVDGADAAVLDIKLSGEHCDHLAMLLRERSIPFLIVTGYSDSALPEEIRDMPRLSKPCGSPAVVHALEQVVAAIGRSPGQIGRVPE